VHRATHELAAVQGSPAWPALATLPPPVQPALDFPVATLARQRRSALDFHGATAIDARTFHAMLDALMVRENIPRHEMHSIKRRWCMRRSWCIG
jgi:hypothetical protein